MLFLFKSISRYNVFSHTNNRFHQKTPLRKAVLRLPGAAVTNKEVLAELLELEPPNRYLLALRRAHQM